LKTEPGFQQPSSPPSLALQGDTVYFSELGTNNRLDADETATISFTLTNRGKGKAQGLQANVKEKNNIQGLSYEMVEVPETIEPGEQGTFKLKLEAAHALATGKAAFRFEVKEHFGFDASPVSVTVPTKAFQPPRPVIADHVFTSPATGKMQKGVSINLKMAVQNRGGSSAKDVTVTVKPPENVLSSGKQEFAIGALKPGQTREFTYTFFTNNRYNRSEVPLQVTVTESYGQYGTEQTYKATLQEYLQKTATIEIEGEDEEATTYEDIQLQPKVDQEIPQTNANRQNTYALVMGNEDYASQQTSLSQESNVPYARNDAEVFAQYLTQTLGVPGRQVFIKKDATYAQMKQGLAKLKELAKVENGKARLIFYYAGHGLPDQQTKKRYLMPVDVSGNNLPSALPLNEVYKALNAHETERVTAFIDACFSGAARQKSLVAMRNVKIKPKENPVSNNMVVFASSSGKQPSLAYEEKKHGLFTYYLLKKWHDTKGQTTYGEMADYIKTRVRKKAVMIHERQQTPQLNAGNEVKESWEEWTFR